MSKVIDLAKSGAVNSMEHFLTVLSFVPKDRLDWTPFPSAKSSMQIAAHTAVTAGNFAQMIRDRRLPQGDEITEFVAQTQERERALRDLPEMEALFRSNTQDILAAMDTLSPEELDITLDSGVGWSMPMTHLLNLPNLHAFAHTAQIDYLQTCWDDQEIHF